MKKKLSLWFLLAISLVNAQLSKEYIETKHFNSTSQFKEVKSLLSAQPNTLDEAKKFYLEITPQIFMLERLMWEEDTASKHAELSRAENEEFEKQNAEVYNFFLNSLPGELQKVDQKFGLDFSKIYLDYNLSVSPGLFFQAIHQKTLLENLKKGLKPENLMKSREEAAMKYADFEAMNILLWSIKKHAENNKYYNSQYKILQDVSSEMEKISNEIINKTF